MNTVQPIRDFELIEDIGEFLRLSSYRNFVLWSTGIYAPIRISDILDWKVRDVRNKDFVSIREKKTGNEQLFPINSELRKILDHYIDGKKDYEYLFASRQKNGKGIYGPISRQQAYYILNVAAKYFKLQNIGCHTMRKTFGYHYYQQTGDIITLQEIYGHSHFSITKRYIGLTQEMKNKAVKDFKYKKLRKSS
ncbi:MAG: site-specific integrase [Tenericutes bacterium HGW-Tenericutes-1]|nr:MAG: site-specific integrase [Tenericutes bacterium HGW-Tenericutes-1]PKM95794.1 MAG: site-specific integrase [Firmicutes bacterium HGW-Firmicutes-1]